MSHMAKSTLRRPAKGDTRQKTVISKIRKETKLSVAEFAKKLGIPKPTLKALGKGELKNLHADYRRRLRMATGVDVDSSTADRLQAYKPPGPFNADSFDRWDHALEDAKSHRHTLVAREQTNLKVFFEIAADRRKFWIAHLLFELALRDMLRDLGLMDDLQFALQRIDRIKALGGNLADENRAEKFLEAILKI